VVGSDGGGTGAAVGGVTTIGGGAGGCGTSVVEGLFTTLGAGRSVVEPAGEIVGSPFAFHVPVEPVEVVVADVRKVPLGLGVTGASIEANPPGTDGTIVEARDDSVVGKAEPRPGRLSIGVVAEFDRFVVLGAVVVEAGSFDGGGREEGRLADGILSGPWHPTTAPSTSSPIPDRRIHAGRRRSPCVIGQSPSHTGGVRSAGPTPGSSVTAVVGRPLP